MRRLYSATELRAFEAREGITLPAAYEGYLLTVGIVDLFLLGGSPRISNPRERLRQWTSGDLPVSCLEDWHQPYEEPEGEEQLLARTFVPDERLGNRDRIPRLLGGAMRIVNVGCESYVLLVVSGPWRNSLWFDSLSSRVALPIKTMFGRHLHFNDVARPLGGGTLCQACTRLARGA